MMNTQLSLKNRTVLVTGATGGIGEAIISLLGSAGATLYLNGTNEEKLLRLSEHLNDQGVDHRYKALNLTESGAAEKLVDACVQEMGRIDVLVNCAGINRTQLAEDVTEENWRTQLAEDVTEENWDAVHNINLKALFFICQAAGREMIKHRRGKIINISSQAGSVAIPFRAAYCSSKGGADQLTRVLALEWSKYNINVNAVAPTFVETEMTKKMFDDSEFKKFVLDSIPLGRMAKPEEVAYPVLFLVDGGWTIK
ncbi:MAG: SDR family NAD(P)-dependent oxidoreductase [Deltaproteobacteria bacterium]|nr:SDR family NAD(P)-dependent oxidoreductase [Deltaproteobacteria bacterium]